jgi:hypothetical protein
MICEDDITLVQTCGACPEQYDAFLNEKQVGYLRLRHGLFYVAYPDASGVRIYEAEPEGDGVFEDHERERYLTEAKGAIVTKLSINEQSIP